MPGTKNRSARDVVSFGVYTLYPAERRLEKAEIALQLGGRAVDILIALAERGGKIVSARELMAEVWPDGAVDDSSLRFHMTTLRKALGDGQSGARYIANISGRGYCFVAPYTRSGVLRMPVPPVPIGDRLLLDHAGAYSVASFHDLALGWKGALSFRRGNAEEPIRLLRTSLRLLDGIQNQLMRTAFLSELAEALAVAAHRDEDLAAIDEAITRIDHTGEFMHLSEALRIRGDILVSGTMIGAPGAGASEAEECLLRSLACAREQRSLSWELRSATNLARMLFRQRRADEARLVLAPVYGRFNEGFETVDLKAAKWLLDEIQ
jgi:DNA-binding winged helix-turn-helix (wHTH) protein